MSQQVQELIDKIKNEGINSAESQAQEIKENAQKEAQNIIDQAQAQAKQIVTDAQRQAVKTLASTETTLKQSSRDTLLALRKEIENMLAKLISADVKKSLTSEELVGILQNVIGQTVEKGDASSVEIGLNSKDLEKLKEGFLSKLKKELKEKVYLHSSDDVSNGFTISYDEGKSSFEFTDESLANYLSSYLNAQVSTLLNESLNS